MNAAHIRMSDTAHILVVDDDREIRTLLRDYLEKNGFKATAVADGQETRRALERTRFDLIVLDLMLPHESGLEICRELRTRSDIPIVMLTALGEEVDRIVGLEVGADDYLAKPFSPGELVARVRALLRRIRRAQPEAGRPLRYGPIAVDAERHVVAVGGNEVALTAKEFLLLAYLLEHRGRVLSRDVLLTDVWGYRYTGGTRTVDVHIRRLREKLPLLARSLVTVKQFGYKLLESPDSGD